MWSLDNNIVLCVRGNTSFEVGNAVEGGFTRCTSSWISYKQRSCPLSWPKSLQSFIWWGIQYTSFLNLDLSILLGYSCIPHIYILEVCRTVILHFHALAWWRAAGTETLTVRIWHSLLPSFLKLVCVVLNWTSVAVVTPENIFLVKNNSKCATGCWYYSRRWTFQLACYMFVLEILLKSRMLLSLCRRTFSFFLPSCYKIPLISLVTQSDAPYYQQW